MSFTPSKTHIAVNPVYVLDYILLYAYPAAFIGAIFFSVNSFMNIQPMTILANNHIVMILNAYVAVAGAVSLLYWLEDSNLPPVNTVINSISDIYNINTIKETSDSFSNI